MMTSPSNSAFQYWGKAEPSEKTGIGYHLLPYHCLDVAAVGKILLESQTSLLQKLGDLSGIETGSFLYWAIFLLAIHDIGKFADSFQNLRPDLFNNLQKRSTHAPYTERHDILGYRFCIECGIETFMKKLVRENASSVFDADIYTDLGDLLKIWLCAVTGHHGRPPKIDMNSMPIQRLFPDQVLIAASAFMQELLDMFLPDGLPFPMDTGVYDCFHDRFKRTSWLMAGLAVVSDWIGSNQRWFPYCTKNMPLEDYWHNFALQQAEIAVKECGLTAADIAPSLGMQMLFPNISTATPLQKMTEEMDTPEGPQLFIFEEVTGGGKTEAALTLTHRLMARGLADGLFMALPTMATANAMHTRIKAVYKKLFLGNHEPSLILAHSASRMTLDLEMKNLKDKGYSQGDGSASQDCAAWLADSRKKSLLAHVGVGTIDQALLSVLPVRHQPLRLLGLARKVLIVDEVHACDAYVHRLLCTLLKFHAAHGNSAILLSATLPRKMRNELINAFAEGTGENTVGAKSNAYPLLTHFSRGEAREVSVATRGSVSRRVECKTVHSVDGVNGILQEALEAGGCACWVRNTVYDALQAYSEWMERLGKDRVMLFHARIALGDRLNIEKEVIRIFGPDSPEKDRRGKLLIATQVVEQSLDLDFDFMVSDLAPIDLLIQRAGRLHRHDRGPRKSPVLGIYMPQPVEEAGKEWFSEMFPKGAGVYKHYGQLWLTARWIYDRMGFSMPDDAREMIEYVYGECSQTEIPMELKHIEDNSAGEDSADRGLASLNSLKLDEGYKATMTNWQDDVLAPTRLGEPTVTVRLARLDGSGIMPWFSEDTGHDWELSQLSIRKKRISREDTGYMPEDVARARETMPDEGRYCVVIPMQQSEGTWAGQAINDYGKIVNITYDRRIGLEFKEGGEG